MIRNVALAFFLFLSILSHAQEKYDYIWLFGYHPEPGFPNPIIGGSKLDFNHTPPDTSSFVIPIDFLAIAMISDTAGRLQFYSNACEIINRNHEIMANGGGINPGVYHDVYCSGGYPLDQGVLILPFPNHSKQYILFHIRKQDTGEKRELLYTIVDMDTPDSLGKVLIKNQLLFTGYLDDMMTAVRHGNGRDWWIILPKDASNEFYFFRLTPEGVLGPKIEQSGQAWNYKEWSGQAVFSPDGAKYVRTNPYNGLHIANFDRCIGEFNNPVIINFINDTISSSGAAFSQNSRYLYVSASSKVYQFDTWAGNIAATKKTVAIYDGFQSPFSTRFFQQMLAPDGKIYITSPSSNNILHVIHNPDIGGLGCNLEQHGLILPTLHAFMTPNFPHFRLYDLAGSPCDTLGIDGPAVATGEPGDAGTITMTLMPNPASGSVAVYLDSRESGEVALTGITGDVRYVQYKTAGSEQVIFHTEPFPAGLYIVSFRAESGRQISRKLVIRR